MKTITGASQIGAVLPGGSQLPQTALGADTLRVPHQLPLVPTRRIIVLVPTGEIDEHALARRVWQLATNFSLDVLYLALTPDAAQVSSQRLRLIGMAAQTVYPHVRVETGVYTEKNWSQALRQPLRPGDLLVCLAEDRVPGFLRRQALGERLATDLDVPIYELGDLQVIPAPLFRYWVKNVLGWIGAIALMVVFFWLQVMISRSFAELQGSILMYLSVLVVMFGLWKINDWMG